VSRPAPWLAETVAIAPDPLLPSLFLVTDQQHGERMGKRRYRFEEVFYLCDKYTDVKPEFLFEELGKKLDIKELKEIARRGLKYINIEIDKKYEQWFKKYYNVFDQVLRSRAITALLMRAKKYYIRTHKVEVKRCNCTLPEIRLEDTKLEPNLIDKGIHDPDEWVIRAEKVIITIPDNWRKSTSTNEHELYYHPVKLLHFIEIDSASEKNIGNIIVILYEVK